MRKNNNNKISKKKMHFEIIINYYSLFKNFHLNIYMCKYKYFFFKLQQIKKSYSYNNTTSIYTFSIFISYN